MKKILFSILFAIGTLSGCGEIESESKTSSDASKVGNVNIAGFGDTILSIENSESLPNAFGGADIFGRTRPTGTTTVFYAGFQNGKAQFSRRDVSINSQKTTMNTTPLVLNPSSQTTYSGTLGGVPYSGYSTTTAYPVILPPNTPRDQITGVRDVLLSVGIGQSVIVSGNRITVVSADQNQVAFKLSALGN